MRSIVNVGIGMAAVALLAIVATSSSFAQSSRNSPEKRAEKAVKVRQSNLQIINYAYTPLGDMLKKRAPFDAELAQRNAGVLVALAPLVVDTFKPDTRAFTVKTWASDSIWTRFQDFEAKNADFVKAVAVLAEAAKSKDEKKTLQAVAAVGQTCSNCHDDYTP